MIIKRSLFALALLFAALTAAPRLRAQSGQFSGAPPPVVGSITTSAGNVQATFQGMGCAGIQVTGAFSGGMPLQQSNDGVTWNPADYLQQVNGTWGETIGSAGTYYTGGYSATFIRVLGPTTSGTANIIITLSQHSCDDYVLAIPQALAGNGFPGGSVTATTTQTTVATALQGHESADVQVVWTGITGSPSGCFISVFSSNDAVSYMTSGVPQAVTPGTNILLNTDGPLGLASEFIYSCSVYPSAGTINIKPLFKPGSKRFNIANTPLAVNVTQFNTNFPDVCQEAKFPPSNSHITTATTTLAIAAGGAGKISYVCGFYATLTGTGTQTIKIIGGTQTTTPCDTGAFPLTPVWATALTSAVLGNLASNSIVGSGGANGQICIVTTGTTVVADVWIAYVQQ